MADDNGRTRELLVDVPDGALLVLRRNVLTAIIGLLGGLRAAIFAALALSLAGYLAWQSWQLSRARADADHWRASAVTYAAANRATVEAFERYRADQERAEAALARDAARAVARAAEAERHIQEARDAADDRPYGPVLRRYYERLLLDREAPSGGGDPVRGPEAPGGPAEVR